MIPYIKPTIPFVGVWIWISSRFVCAFRALRHQSTVLYLPHLPFIILHAMIAPGTYIGPEFARTGPTCSTASIMCAGQRSRPQGTFWEMGAAQWEDHLSTLGIQSPAGNSA